MIIAQALLVVAVLTICVKFLASSNSTRTKAWKRILLILFAIGAVIVILFPNLTNEIAGIFGIGRGADLLLYTLVIAFIFDQVNGYIRQKHEQQQLTRLARKLALLEAKSQSSNNVHK